MTSTKRYRLTHPQLTVRLPASWIPFKRTTAELRSYRGIIGQERAMRAVEVGLRIPTRGFNIYAAGEAGSGKTSTLDRLLREQAASEPVPQDLCYVHNFSAPDSPRPLLLPPGQGRRLARDMDRTVSELQRMVPRTLSDGAFGHIQTAILAETHSRAQTLLRRTARAAERMGLRIEEDDEALQVVPLVDGEPLAQGAYEKLSRRQRRKLEEKMVAFQEHLDAHANARRQLEEDHARRQRAAEVRAITPLVDKLIKQLATRYARLDGGVGTYLDEVHAHILEHHRVFMPPSGDEGDSVTDLLAAAVDGGGDEDPLRVYQVNVLVDRAQEKGAPVVMEHVPSPAKLCGYFEYRIEQSRMVADHTNIRAGALHRANGGYLLLQISELMTQENAWDSLKRALRHKRVRIDEEANLVDGRLRVAGAMKPGSVPLRLKVILVGSEEVYYILKLEDEEFSRLFKIKAAFEPSMPRTRDNVQRLARFLGQVCGEEGYLPLHRAGFGRMVEMATRRAAHKQRMTTHRAELLDVLAEADFYARERRARGIHDRDVTRALEEVERRHGSVVDAVDRAIAEGTIQIRTRGMSLGEINGIALYNLAGTSFGLPVRITVRAYAGRLGVINIDREVQLSGAIHDKGALILVGYLGGRYAQAQTLGLSASITFEQSYDEIDGDSASSAELYALLSALSGCPLRQGIAVTGSVNQLGEIQQIGGVNEKVEGIFRICDARGLTGDEGVMIPAANVKNLVLHRDVVAAVRARRFNIHAVSTVDEGIEVLTGFPAGRRRRDGWTPDSINARVQDRLAELQQVLRSSDPAGGVAL